MKKLFLSLLFFILGMTCFAKVISLKKTYSLGSSNVTGTIYWNDKGLEKSLAEDDWDDVILAAANIVQCLNANCDISMYVKPQKGYLVFLYLDKDNSEAGLVIFLVRKDIDFQDIIFFDVYKDYNSAKTKYDEFKNKYYNLIANQ